MVSLENYRNPEFVEYCNQALKEYVELYAGINAALLATPDGFEITSYAHKQTHSDDKLAAVGSSLFALGTSLVQEFELKDCNSIILDSEKGKVHISSIKSLQHSIILMVQTNEQAMLGNVVHGAKKLSEKIVSGLVKVSVN